MEVGEPGKLCIYEFLAAWTPSISTESHSAKVIFTTRVILRFVLSNVYY
jgi:hypothetical protein